MSAIIEKRTSHVAMLLRDVRDGRNKRLMYCEGAKLLDELLKSDIRLHAVYCKKEFSSEVKSKLSTIPRAEGEVQGPQIVALSDSVMNFVSDVRTPPGVIALAHRPREPAPFSSSGSDPAFILVLHELQLPQNIGALARTAEAAGVKELWLTKNSADAFGPKALRGSTGSLFRLPVRQNLDLREALEHLRSEKISIVAANQNGETSYEKYDWRRSVALVLGSEGAGFSEEEKKMFNTAIRIPMKGRVESLNVAAAAAICLFEAARQRGGVTNAT